MLKNSTLNLKNSLAKELYKIRNPGTRDLNQQSIKQLQKEVNLNPVSKVPQKEIFWDLTSARNRELITPDEQALLRNTTVGFWGLSVGSHAALTWMMQSRANTIKIVDPDTIDATNLNRLRFGWNSVGQLKTHVVKKQLQEINPFVKVVDSTLTHSSAITELVNDSPALNIVIDAIDDISGKLLLRKLCKQRKIPLVSAADVGDNVIIDIERYDSDPDLEYFLGRLQGIDNKDLTQMTPAEKGKLIVKLVTFDHCSEKMIESMLAIGKTIPTWPQLGATATIAGGAITTIIKKIVLQEKIMSGRYVISLDEILVADYQAAKRKKKRHSKLIIAQQIFE
jgi:tRNA threonylcarbamoyladenosine dehydratase